MDDDVKAWIEAAAKEGIALTGREIENANRQVSDLKASGLWDMLDSCDGIGAARHIPLKRKSAAH